MRNSVVIVGAYVNACGIVDELYEYGVQEIFIVSDVAGILRQSKKVSGFYSFSGDGELHLILDEISKKVDRLVVFATSDEHVNSLDRLRGRLASNVAIPFREGASRLQNKVLQYEACEQLGVPYPAYRLLSRATGWESSRGLRLPVIVKPTERLDVTNRDVPRNAVVANWEEMESLWRKLAPALDEGVAFLACEIVPGPSTNIYAYVAHRSADRGIINEWCGRKLSQAPDDYGVFSIASNESVPEVIEQGRKLLEGLSLTGFNEPEFKLDARDGTYKLMEINLRSMMWNRVGTLSGVPLHYSQFLEACGQDIPVYEQTTERIYLINLASELVSIFTRRRYLRQYHLPVLRSKGCKHIACLDWSDPLPFVRLMARVPRMIVAIWWRRLSERLP